MKLKETLLNYAERHYETYPDYPFKRSPDTAILRHRKSRKWFGAIMTISPEKLGLDNQQKIDVISVKLAPELIDILRSKEGYFPAYHLNKEHWITIILDGSVPQKEICSLLDESYYLTSL